MRFCDAANAFLVEEGLGSRYTLLHSIIYQEEEKIEAANLEGYL